ncbi:unnamed protein product [Adineta ricciae]|uniref:G-protein coupled receptors family 1 profile domain-containing protein n=1 Tax=Adineta ricciae TaxID=249248 RepID=A0A816F4U6_ADIRI|nr:unnamed protein product [Adineta ricciae]CAF1657864.1 unnamed protein product [Adineta ricciae]
MSAAYYYILSLASANTNIYKIGGPILIAIGTLSCFICLSVFTRKSLRRNPCSIYLIASYLSNFLMIYTSILISTLGTGYNINPSAYNLVFCRFRYYITLVCDVLSPSYLIFAAIDRVFVTSRDALVRQRSTPRLAYLCIIVITLFWLIFHIHALVFTVIIDSASNIGVCYFQPGMYLTLISYYSMIIKAILIPLLMIILGLWTVSNVRALSNVAAITTHSSLSGIGAAMGGIRSARSKDRQLIKIILVDTSIYILFNTMISVLLVYQQVMQNQVQPYVQLYLQGFVMSVSVFSAYIPFCIGCYTNLFVSKTFRHEVKKLLTCQQ